LNIFAALKKTKNASNILSKILSFFIYAVFYICGKRFSLYAASSLDFYKNTLDSV